MKNRKLLPVHPGEILLEEFMNPYDISQNALGDALNVSPRRINEIVNGKRAVTPDTAIRLARYFGTTPQFWVNLQSNYDLEVALDNQDSVASEIPVFEPASRTALANRA